MIIFIFIIFNDDSKKKWILDNLCKLIILVLMKIIYIYKIV